MPGRIWAFVIAMPTQLFWNTRLPKMEGERRCTRPGWVLGGGGGGGTHVSVTGDARLIRSTARPALASVPMCDGLHLIPIWMHFEIL